MNVNVLPNTDEQCSPLHGDNLNVHLLFNSNEVKNFTLEAQTKLNNIYQDRIELISSNIDITQEPTKLFGNRIHITSIARLAKSLLNIVNQNLEN